MCSLTVLPIGEMGGVTVEHLVVGNAEGNWQALRQWECREMGRAISKHYVNRNAKKMGRATAVHILVWNVKKIGRETAEHFINGNTQKWG